MTDLTLQQLRKIAAEYNLKPSGKFPADANKLELTCCIADAGLMPGSSAAFVVSADEIIATAEPDNNEELFEKFEPVPVPKRKAKAKAKSSGNGNGNGGNGFLDSLESLIKSTVESMDLDIRDDLNNGLTEYLEEWSKKQRPGRIEIFINKEKTAEITGAKHPKFEEVLTAAAARIPIYLVGPSGSGKSHLARQVAEALNLEFDFLPLTGGISESYLIGRFLPTGESGKFEYMPAPFVNLYRDGGVFLLDEFDAADPNTLLIINSAISNGHLTLPNGTQVQKHPDFVLIATANTFGNGGNRVYAGRQQLDGATLDRFVMGTIEIEYNEKLEKDLSGDSELCRWIHEIRMKLAVTEIRRIVSSRFILDGMKLLAAGAELDYVKSRLFLSWTDTEKQQIGV